jgi:hypothetical protein
MTRVNRSHQTTHTHGGSSPSSQLSEEVQLVRDAVGTVLPPKSNSSLGGRVSKNAPDSSAKVTRVTPFRVI